MRISQFLLRFRRVACTMSMDIGGKIRDRYDNCPIEGLYLQQYACNASWNLAAAELLMSYKTRGLIICAADNDPVMDEETQRVRAIMVECLRRQGRYTVPASKLALAME